MKIESYPYKKKRRFGAARKSPHDKDIRVDSWDKIKTIVLFIGNGKAYGLTENKEYEVIRSEAIWNTDEEIRKEEHKRFKQASYYHTFGNYFKIKNDNGKIRSFPQTLFKSKELNK